MTCASNASHIVRNIFCLLMNEWKVFFAGWCTTISWSVVAAKCQNTKLQILRFNLTPQWRNMAQLIDSIFVWVGPVFEL